MSAFATKIACGLDFYLTGLKIAGFYLYLWKYKVTTVAGPKMRSPAMKTPGRLVCCDSSVTSQPLLVSGFSSPKMLQSTLALMATSMLSNSTLWSEPSIILVDTRPSAPTTFSHFLKIPLPEALPSHHIPSARYPSYIHE